MWKASDGPSDAPAAVIRAKIVATLGPATDAPDAVAALVAAGMSAARLNFSHGTHAEHARRIGWIREVSGRSGRPIAVIQDLQGPRLRVGPVRPGTVLAAGRSFVLDGRAAEGDAAGVGLDEVAALAAELSPGERILIDDGRLVLRVVAVTADTIGTEVVVGGPLGAHKGINLPDSTLSLAPLTDKDREDLAFGLAQGVDYVALSFVKSAADVRGLQALIRDLGGDARVIAKIERREAVADMEAIVDAADGVMVARGDLALEIGPARVPAVQKALIRAANAAAIPVITATQMLDSMIRNPQPTRAETSDVANAILDGTDAVMLSGETAVGAYPVAAVAEMAAIAAEAERILPHQRLGRRTRPGDEGKVTYAISQAAVEIARRVGVKAIIAVTTSGLTARRVAHHRPEMPLLGATREAATWRRLALVWGVTPVRVGDFEDTDGMVHVVCEAARDLGVVAEDDPVVITSGLPIGRPGSTNMVQVRRIGDGRLPAVLRPEG